MLNIGALEETAVTKPDKFETVEGLKPGIKGCAKAGVLFLFLNLRMSYGDATMPRNNRSPDGGFPSGYHSPVTPKQVMGTLAHKSSRVALSFFSRARSSLLHDHGLWKNSRFVRPEIQRLAKRTCT